MRTQQPIYQQTIYLLIRYYLYEKDIPINLDYRIDYAKLFTPPEQDIKIIKHDFDVIVEKIRAGKPITITDPTMTRFIMSLDEAVDLVLFAFEHGVSGDILVQKAPACTIKTQAEAVCELFGGDKDKIKVIGIRHGEKMYETLLTNEECANAIDMGDFYRVPCDKRDLNYDKYNTGFTKYFKGYCDYIRKIKARYPDLYIENCASGGMRMTVRDCELFDGFWPTDNQSPYYSLRIFKDTILRMPPQCLNGWISVRSAEKFSYGYGTDEMADKLFATNDATWNNVVSVNTDFLEGFMKGRSVALSFDLTLLSEEVFEKLIIYIRQIFWKNNI